MLIYRVLSILLFPFLELYLIFRVIKKKEDKSRLKERFGHATKSRPKGELIWLHAVSVGEANSALILVDELLNSFPKISILFTTATLTSAAIIAQKLPQFHDRVLHQFLPIDSYFCVQNFLNFWQPRAAVFVESEIWPNLIYEAHRRGVLSFLINARMSEKSFSKWRLGRLSGFRIFDYFAAIFAQTKDEKKRFEMLTDQEIFFCGNLKSQAQNLMVDEEKLAQLKLQIGERKIFVAASTHKGEEELVLLAHQRLRKNFSDLLTIIILRHPSRADEVKNLLDGKNFVQRSQNQDIVDATEIYLVDSLGELGIFYSLANFAFIGGSLLPIGGHNPFEAIKLGCTVISGSQVFNFKEIYNDLVEKNACAIVGSVDELVTTVQKFIRDEDVCKAMSDKALDMIKNSDNIAKNIVAKMDQVLAISS